MPRNKTFRKRNQKKIQKGGAFNMGESTFPKIESTTETKYYAYVVKTRKSSSSSSRSSSSSSSSSSIGGGTGSIIVAVSTLPTEYEYTTTIVDEEQRQKICNNESENTAEKAKIITGAGAGADNLKQFVDDESRDELITFFELNGGTETTLNGLTITKENVKWNDYVPC